MAVWWLSNCGGDRFYLALPLRGLLSPPSFLFPAYTLPIHFAPKNYSLGIHCQCIPKHSVTS
jgi:hypothetical protein